MSDQPSSDPEMKKVLQMSQSGRKWWWIAGFAVLGFSTLCCIGSVVALRPTVSYETESVSRGDLTVIVEATGTLEALETVQVGAEVSGRLTEVFVDYNDQVTTGQTLANIDPEQYRASLDQAEAQLRAAKAHLAEARASELEARLAYERAQTEFGKGLISRGTLEVRQATANRLKATITSASANYTLAEANVSAATDRLEKTTILAPIDGVVLARHVSPGQTVTAGFQTPRLFDIARDLSQMRLIVDIDEADVGRVAEGYVATFRVDAFPNDTFPSQIQQLRLEPRVTQNVVTYQAVLEVDNSEHKLRPGMTATASIEVAKVTDALLASNDALRFVPKDEEKASDSARVWALSNGAPTAIPVKRGVSDGIFTVITSGELTEGQEIIVEATTDK